MAKHHIAKQKVTFSYVAPEANDVLLAGDFTGWEQSPVSLKKDKSGVWKGTVSLPPGEYVATARPTIRLKRGERVECRPMESPLNRTLRPFDYDYD